MDLEVKIREAARQDIESIVEMLASDPLGSKRENLTSPLPRSYYGAFDEISNDVNNILFVAEVKDVVAGVLQLTIIPYLTYQGGKRGLIEGVRVASAYRRRGIGEQLFEYAIGKARQRGCHLVQLTTDKSRPDALRFYEKLGFVASHEGLKLHLESRS